MLVFAALVGVLALMFLRLPTSFLPAEDQGRAQLQFTLPLGRDAIRAPCRRCGRSNATSSTEEKEDVPMVFLIVGQSQAGAGQNAGRGFIALAPWDERKGVGAQRGGHHPAGHPAKWAGACGTRNSSR